MLAWLETEGAAGAHRLAASLGAASSAPSRCSPVVSVLSSEGGREHSVCGLMEERDLHHPGLMWMHLQETELTLQPPPLSVRQLLVCSFVRPVLRTDPCAVHAGSGRQ